MGKRSRLITLLVVMRVRGWVRGWVIRLGIFDSPQVYQGYDYSKPKAYLARRLAESSRSTQQIHNKFTGLLQCTYSL